MGRAPCCEKVGLKRGRWTAEEDEILINFIKQNGEGSWRSLPKNAGLLRCGKSCRLRWINYLRTDLKRGNFTREEEETIIKLHRTLGNKWSAIASNLPGRTDNEVKNYWNSHLSRKIYSFRSSNGSIVTTLDMIKIAANSSKRKRGRVSRAVAKKYNMSTISKTTAITSSSRTKLEIGSISGTQEATAAEIAVVDLSRTTSGMPEFGAAENAKLYDSGVGTAEVISGEKDFHSINSINDLSCDGLEGCHEILWTSPEKLEGENEALKPNEKTDDVTLLVEQILQSELMDLSEISFHNKEAENDSNDPESSFINKESDCGAINSNTDSGDDLYECFSPLNSYLNHELVAWDTEYAFSGFGLWDAGNDTLWL